MKDICLSSLHQGYKVVEGQQVYGDASPMQEQVSAGYTPIE